MRLTAAAVAVTLIACVIPANAAAAVYACEVRDAKRLDKDGVPVADADSERNLRLYPRFTFDDRTGRLTGMQDDWVLSLLQKAVGQNALLAVSIHKGIGNTGVKLLKIDTFEKDKMPFVWISDDRISTGVCTTGGG